ncbi:MAG: TIGR02270 family protein [Enhygromyxa sp.]
MSPGSHHEHPSAEEILWDVQGQHLDEAEFLFEVWEDALDAPGYTLAELAEGLEHRLLAHVNALVIGGPLVAQRLLLPTVEDPDACRERVAAAILAVWNVTSEQDRDRIIAVLTGGEDGPRDGVARALELVDDPRLDERLVRAIGDVRGRGTATVLELLARRRARTGDWLIHFLRSDDLSVVRAATRVARHCLGGPVLAELSALAQSEDAAVRHAALEAALLRQVPGAWESALYWAFIAEESPFRRDALTWVSVLGDAAVQQRLLALVVLDEHRRDAIWTAGFSGRIAAVDRCMELLADPEVGPLAGEVVCAIVGLPTDEDQFWRTRDPEADQRWGLPKLQEDDLEASLIPEAEEALLVPDPEAIARWWAERKAAFEAEHRYLGGKVLTAEVMLEALWSAPMRRRHVLGLELQLRTGGELTVDSRRLTHQQEEQLRRMGSVSRLDFQRGLPGGRWAG